MKKITFEQAKKLLDENSSCMIIDVREQEEYITGHAHNAELLPVDSINEQTASNLILKKDIPVIVYCRTGSRSSMAAKRLEALGYSCVYDVGSLSGWPYGLSYD